MSDRVKCLPVFAIRTGNLPVEVLETLRSKCLSTKRVEATRGKERLKMAADHVIDRLYHAIGGGSR